MDLRNPKSDILLFPHNCRNSKRSNSSRTEKSSILEHASIVNASSVFFTFFKAEISFNDGYNVNRDIAFCQIVRFHQETLFYTQSVLMYPIFCL